MPVFFLCFSIILRAPLHPPRSPRRPGVHRGAGRTPPPGHSRPGRSRPGCGAPSAFALSCSVGWRAGCPCRPGRGVPENHYSTAIVICQTSMHRTTVTVARGLVAPGGGVPAAAAGHSQTWPRARPTWPRFTFNVADGLGCGVHSLGRQRRVRERSAQSWVPASG